MKRLTGVCIVAGLAAAIGTSAAYAVPIDPIAGRRVSYSNKGDLFVFPHVKIRWDDKTTPDPSDDVLLQDTFISMTNDDTEDHSVKFYFVDGATWRYADRTLDLTGNQSSYFSAFRGTVGLNGVASFRALNPAGYPDGPNVNIRQLSGFIVGWTVDGNNVPQGTNQLAGSATVVDYQKEAAWEYKPWAYRSLFNGPKPGAPEVLKMDGTAAGYQRTPSQYLIDFFASGTAAFGPSVNPPIVNSTQDFELTLLNLNLDFRAVPDFDMDGTPGEQPLPGGDTEDSEPATTAVLVVSWNEAEVEVSNTVRCLTCWDSTLASRYGFGGVASPFAQTTLQTNKGKARIRGGIDARCERAAGNPNDQILVYSKRSKDLPIIGVAHKIISWGPDRVAKACMSLTALGERTDAFIITDPGLIGPPPTLTAPGSGSVDDSIATPSTRTVRQR